MLQVFTDIFNSLGLPAIFTVCVVIFIFINIRLHMTKPIEKMELLDIDLQIKMDAMRKELREDHDGLCAKVDSVNHKLCAVARHLDIPEEPRVKRCSNRDDDLR